jgi:hypothetical protein
MLDPQVSVILILGVLVHLDEIGESVANRILQKLNTKYSGTTGPSSIHEVVEVLNATE